MNLFNRPDIPPSAKAMSLVRMHHGLDSNGGEEIPQVLDRKGYDVPAAWKKEARLNHLRARRKRVPLSEIQNESFPVILDVHDSSSCVILLERIGEAGYIVQFPDSRESFVSVERLENAYDGSCIFLEPHASFHKQSWQRFFSRN
ncbi:MAG: hypothetical protein AAGA96_15415 [Verrucomicrobiota bacterium]